MPLIIVTTQSGADRLSLRRWTPRKKEELNFLFYPATLKVKYGADYRVFNNPREAEDFLNSRPMTTQERSLRALASEAVSWHTRDNTSQVALRGLINLSLSLSPLKSPHTIFTPGKAFWRGACNDGSRWMTFPFSSILNYCF